VSGRGELHLTILIENMRREGFELAVSRPQVHRSRHRRRAPRALRALTVDVEEKHQGTVMERLGARAAICSTWLDGRGRVRLEYAIPARGLIGFQHRVHDRSRAAPAS
jgi:GTP-binding protein